MPDEQETPDVAEEATPADAGVAPEAQSEAEVETPSVEQQLAERTADLQRLQAEYVNYKRRVDRDRELVRSQGATAVLASLLTALDDIGRAAEHGELEGGFKAVADSVHQAVAQHHLVSFGAKGEVFDPALHEAVFHAGESADVDTTTIDVVMRIGYRVGDRVLRPATVGVVDPVSAEPVAEAQPPVVEPAETPDEPTEN